MVVSRFAPSPTGFLHLGGLRTALFNYLLARSQNGRFLLRIEDTDTARTVPGAANSLADTLKLFGLNYDAGPDKPDSSGPFIQSQRSEIYKSHAEKLLELGGGYRCFCTQHQLEQSRLATKRKNEGYDRRCRHLTPSQIQENLSLQKPYSIRLKVPEGRTSFVDLIHGKLDFANRNLDDGILMKSDGLPTYHLANVVDDRLMGVTHVVRGEEWIPSTPKHILIYKALGWGDEMPQFTHVPLLVNKDGQKLSKRHHDVNVGGLVGKGYLPEAILNFVGLLGFSPSITKDVWFLEDLIKEFKIDALSKSAAIVSYEQLDRLNRLHIAHKLKSPETQHQLLQQTRIDILDKHGDRIQEPLKEKLQSDSHLLASLQSIQSRVTFMHHLSDYASIIYCIPTLDSTIPRDFKSSLLATKIPIPDIIDILANCLTTILEPEWTSANLKSALRKGSEVENVKYANLMKVLRYAVTGDKVGDDLMVLLELVGKESVLERLSLAKK
ncbi:UNVERIFIED_CONTAM: Glutamyl-tRNA synthetase [Siphonaria sp. JEL0065]|nr:Glutamyl-tRNA synthetase [Siphonaria sp. JEL0065]